MRQKDKNATDRLDSKLEDWEEDAKFGQKTLKKKVTACWNSQNQDHTRNIWKSSKRAHTNDLPTGTSTLQGVLVGDGGSYGPFQT